MRRFVSFFLFGWNKLITEYKEYLAFDWHWLMAQKITVHFGLHQFNWKFKFSEYLHFQLDFRFLNADKKKASYFNIQTIAIWLLCVTTIIFIWWTFDVTTI